MEYHIEAGAKTRRYIESVMPSMLTQLGLNRSRRLLVVKVDPDLQEMGTTIPLTGIDTFLVVLKPNRNWVTLGVTLGASVTPSVTQSQLGHTGCHTGTRVDPRGTVCPRTTQAHSQGHHVEGPALQEEPSIP